MNWDFGCTPLSSKAKVKLNIGKDTCTRKTDKTKNSTAIQPKWVLPYESSTRGKKTKINGKMWYNGSHCTANQMEVDVVAPEIKKAVNKFSKKIGPTSILSLKCCVERLKRLCARRIKQITSRNNDEAIKMRREKKFQWAVVRISFGQTCCDFLRCDYFEALWAFFCDFYHTAMAWSFFDEQQSVAPIDSMLRLRQHYYTSQ